MHRSLAVIVEINLNNFKADITADYSTDDADDANEVNAVDYASADATSGQKAVMVDLTGSAGSSPDLIRRL